MFFDSCSDSVVVWCGFRGPELSSSRFSGRPQTIKVRRVSLLSVAVGKFIFGVVLRRREMTIAIVVF